MGLREIKFRREEVWQKGHHNYSYLPVVKLGRREYTLASGAGSNDSISVYREGEQFYVLVVNRRMPYAGLERFDLEHHSRWLRSRSSNDAPSSAV